MPRAGRAAESRRDRPVTELVSEGKYGLFDVLGPVVEFLTPPPDSDVAFTVLKGSMPPGVAVPLHSHPDDESLFLVSGSVQGIVERDTGYTWFDVPPGGFVHVPAGARHAWRNRGADPVVQVIVTTPRLGRFFREAGRPIQPGELPQRPAPEAIRRFQEIARRYGHWLGSPEENAAVGIAL